ncbi:tyrosinase family protein [Aspergillus candidus]|uniref:Tyrosinase central domain protein n=1 Tax=Aspergillus candidus TaxID=41067 RepID=A0A2I2FM34_ASPCN|nr:tyrosinase central domain protein [Aspergillus candidus]PLB41698.1 tyrosinase central domain protein [Aspergillus candidus]
MKYLPKSLLGLLVTAGLAMTSEQCSPETTGFRKDWRALTAHERTEYIEAVWCLRRQPAHLPNDKYPGVRDRLDDFVATHVNYTSAIHSNALLLPWHRHFTYLWETALREECGYTGYVPYWNWPATTNLTEDPLFDGSPTSLSGNGAHDPNEKPRCDPPYGCEPPGTGGGCVTSGPFKDFEIHLGPFNNSHAGPHATLPTSAWHYNPRCLKRSFNQPILDRTNNEAAMQRLLDAPDINCFLDIMDPSDKSHVGSHGAGHRTIGKDMTDVYSSPQDPSFMLHHAMIDRMWTLWQERDIEVRRDALNGTAVMYNPAWAPLVTLDHVLDFGCLDRPRTVREAMDTRRHDYCYSYQ